MGQLDVRRPSAPDPRPPWAGRRGARASARFLRESAFFSADWRAQVFKERRLATFRRGHFSGRTAADTARYVDWLSRSSLAEIAERPEVAAQLAFIKPTFNEEMRGGHTNM